MSSQSPPAYLEASPCPNELPYESFHAPTTLADTSSSSSSSPSLYVTLKVLQLVNTFRKRVQTRVQSGRILKKETSTRVAQDFCQDFERQAFEEIDRYLGRNTGSHSQRKKVSPKYIRRSSSENGLGLGQLEDPSVATATKTDTDEISPKKLQW